MKTRTTMKTKKLEINYKEYSSLIELEEDEQKLINEAIKSTLDSYAPYSQFHVGAAVELESGTIVPGHNIENSVYPVCICAERVALFSSSALYPKEKVIKIAITVKPENFELNSPASPCGSCRQVMIEYESKQQSSIKIILYKSSSYILTFDSARDLLPLSFDETRLKKQIL